MEYVTITKLIKNRK